MPFQKGETKSRAAGRSGRATNRTTVLLRNLFAADGRRRFGAQADRVGRNWRTGRALRICLERAGPVRKDEPVFDLLASTPPPTSVAVAARSWLRSADGDLTPS